MQNDYFPQPEKLLKYSAVQVSTWCALVLFGIFLKLMHWPGSALLVLVCSGGLLGYNLVALFLLRGRSAANNVITILCLLWVLVLGWRVLWNGGHPYNEMGMCINIGSVILTAGINALVYRKYIGRLS